ncbi:MAG: PHP domain-containing protein [Desulfobacterales bacterium]|nr:PHP domain-containing protein [Desulfobacterales bacterium]
MLTKFKADLHIHSCLSPCSDWDMSPKKIVQKSLEQHLDLIAICDHNTAENAAATLREGTRQGIAVLPGMEICSKEEVHLVALFNNIEDTLKMQEYVYAHLPGKNQPEVFGHQVVADEHDQVLGENPRLLIGATRLSLLDIVEKAHHLGGICISAHVDRPSYSLIGQLGFIPEDLHLDAVEVSYRVPLEKALTEVVGISDYPCVTSSDAHFLHDIGKVWTEFVLAAPSLEEIRLALAGVNGRRILNDT